MPLQTPPAEVQLVGVFDHFKEAHEAAKETSSPLLSVLFSDEQRRGEVEKFLSTPDGVHLRSVAVVWFPPNGPSLDDLKKSKVGENANSDIVLFSDKSAPVDIKVHSSQELLRILQELTGPRTNREQRPSLTELRTDYPTLQNPDQFLAFGDARGKDLIAGSKEPFRSWLARLLKEAPHSAIGIWAAFRLVESGATIQPGEVNPVPIVLLYGTRPGSNFLFGWGSLGSIQDIDAQAPYLASFRIKMAKNPEAFSMDIYRFIDQHLTRGDKDWILSCWIRNSAQPLLAHQRVEELSVYALTAEWLLSQGMEEDWQQFLESAKSPAWRDQLMKLMNSVKKIPGYWNSNPDLGLTTSPEASTDSSFWDSPLDHLSALGVDREAFISKGVHYPKIKSHPFFEPVYPATAFRGRSVLTGGITIRCLINQDGVVTALRPIPSGGLAFFAATALQYTSQVSFEPYSVGGKALPDIYTYVWTFEAKP